MKQLIILLICTVVCINTQAAKNGSGNTPTKKTNSCRNWTNNEFADWIEFGVIPQWIQNDHSLVYNQDWFVKNEEYRAITQSQCYSLISQVRDLKKLPMIGGDTHSVATEIRKFEHFVSIGGQMTGNYRDNNGSLQPLFCSSREPYPANSSKKTETDMIYMGYDLGSDVCHNFRKVPIFVGTKRIEKKEVNIVDPDELEYEHKPIVHDTLYVPKEKIVYTPSSSSGEKSFTMTEILAFKALFGNDQTPPPAAPINSNCGCPTNQTGQMYTYQGGNTVPFQQGQQIMQGQPIVYNDGNGWQRGVAITNTIFNGINTVMNVFRLIQGWVGNQWVNNNTNNIVVNNPWRGEHPIDRTGGPISQPSGDVITQTGGVGPLSQGSGF